MFFFVANRASEPQLQQHTALRILVDLAAHDLCQGAVSPKEIFDKKLVLCLKSLQVVEEPFPLQGVKDAFVDHGSCMGNDLRVILNWSTRFLPFPR